ncbi:MAG: hypothetical protein Hals2KO_05720 [Halioglobus sp.]
MTDVDIPDFGALLAPYITSVPPEAIPAFLARLERTAADRYRQWAEALPEHAEGLLACAAREDHIADEIEVLYPASSVEQVAAMDAAISPARDTYYAVFSTLTPIEQMTIQANAERQGAAAWRGMLAQEENEASRAVLEHCASTEEASADYLDALLAGLPAS